MNEKNQNLVFDSELRVINRIKITVLATLKNNIEIYNQKNKFAKLSILLKTDGSTRLGTWNVFVRAFLLEKNDSLMDLKEGDIVEIEGTLHFKKFDTKENKIFNITEILADNITLKYPREKLFKTTDSFNKNIKKEDFD